MLYWSIWTSLVIQQNTYSSSSLMTHVVYSSVAILHHKYGRRVADFSASVAGWTSTQKCLCNHQATLPLPVTELFLCNDSQRESTKTETGVRARPAISCLISQLPVPRCPVSSSFPYFIFQRQSSFSAFSMFFSVNLFCDEHKSPSVWQTMSVCVPILYGGYSEWTCLSPGHEQFFILLHHAQKLLHLWAIVATKQSVRIKQTQWLLFSTTYHLYFIHFLLYYWH